MRSALDCSRALVEEIRHLNTLDRAGCLEAWRAAFGRSPPKYLSIAFMQRVLIWELQRQRLGGVSRKTKTQLDRIAKGKGASPQIKTGAYLVREWNGRTYQVEAVDGGFAMDGKTYRSLSGVARRITGAHWSGPRFFGVD